MIDTDNLSKHTAKLEERFKLNTQFFKESMPLVYPLIEKGKPELTLDPTTGRIEKYEDGKNIYGRDSLLYAQEEVKHFENLVKNSDYRLKPTSIVLAHLIQPEPFRKTVEAYAKSYVLNQPSRPHYMNLAIFGIGLGYHIEILCNQNKHQHITIIENDVNNFVASLYTINWYSLVKELHQGQFLSFVIKDPDESIDEFNDKVRFQFSKLFPSNYNSNLIYNHLQEKTEPTYKDIKKIILDFSKFSYIAFERLGPDCQRLMNANENCTRKKPMINLQKTKIAKENTKIAIIGAGPSLDDYIEELREHRDKFIIISCGSSLESLLINRIKPDYHFELEFLNLATDLIKHTSKKYDLSEIDLICSFEANPGISEYFRNTYQFVQETNELVSNVGREYVLHYGGLTCTNGASALFSRICDNDIYFFGLDFAHTHGAHHAKDNITNQSNLSNDLKSLEDFGKILNKRGIEVTKSVYGEDINTSNTLNSARLLIERLIINNKNKYYNCSNGAKIDGTIHIEKGKIRESFKGSYESNNKVIFNTDVFDTENINSISFAILKSSFNVAEQVLDIVKDFENTSPNDACIRIHNLVGSITKETINQTGQYRSIMSIIRLPIILLFQSINFSNENDYNNILINWIKDYTSYIKFIKTKLLPPFEKKDFHIKEDWLDSFNN
jgi:hypothetical protein